MMFTKGTTVKPFCKLLAPFVLAMALVAGAADAPPANPAAPQLTPEAEAAARASSSCVLAWLNVVEADARNAATLAASASFARCCASAANVACAR